MGVHGLATEHHTIEDEDQQYHGLEYIEDYNNLICHIQKTLDYSWSKRLW
jgi:hypothetical protein